MTELAELYRFNVWANRNLMAGVRKLRPDQLQECRDGMYRSIISVLSHLAGVELGYLSLIRSEKYERRVERPLDEIEKLLEQTSAGLIEVAQSWPLHATFHIPWFERDFTVAQGLRQVLSHSASHRADVNQWLPQFGVESTEQDYILMVLKET